MNVIFVNPFFNAAPVTWTFVASATSTGATITIPAGAQEGDVAILADYATTSFGAPASVTPAGWTAIGNLGPLTSGVAQLRVNSSRRLLGSSPGGTSFTGMSGGSQNRKNMIVLRPSAPLTGLAVGGLTGEVTNNKPVAQNITSASGTTPLVAVAIYASGSAVDPRTFSPAADGEVVNQPSLDGLYLKYKIYNSGPADISVDMDDEGAFNTLQSFYIEAT